MLKLLIIFIIAILLIYYGATLIYLIRNLVGKYEEAEINTVRDAYSFAVNPLNWIKLYKAFFILPRRRKRCQVLNHDIVSNGLFFKEIISHKSEKPLYAST